VNPFQRLSPFIQEYVYEHGWEELHSVQARAIEAILGSRRHVLISSGTASGKTEAAFFPILTEMQSSGGEGVFALYVGPLKALINDQFSRLQGLIGQAGAHVWRWHGDVGATQKKRFFERPSGILQITPESLESMLIRHATEVPKLFGSLKYVVVDEVHAFMGTDRGSQLLCQIAKIERWAKASPRRIGLSATLGDEALAASWIGMGSKEAVEVISEPPAKAKIALLCDWHRKSAEAGGEEDPAEAAYYEALYGQVARSKCILFANSRGEAEEAVARLRSLAAKKRHPDVFYVHHGSISKMLREEAEEAMKAGEGPAATAATLTLELGIDVGELEKIAQIGAPYTESSFVQRIGRSGRKAGEIPKMYFTYLEEAVGGGGALDEIPWHLLQMIAVIQLYAEERWIEPIREKPCPYSLLFHQTLSLLASVGERKPSALAREVLALPPFRGVPQEDYRALLRHMLETGHLERMDEGTLIVGKKAEGLVSHYSFYAVFPEDEEYQVSSEGRPLGSVNTLPPEGTSIVLAGRFWQVVSVDLAQKCVFVKPTKKSEAKLWRGGGGEVHNRVVERMRQALEEERDYPYLTQRAKGRLAAARLYARERGVSRRGCLQNGDRGVLFLPWAGTRQVRTWSAIFRKPSLRERLGVLDVALDNGYAFAIGTELEAQEFLERLNRAMQEIPDARAIVEEGKAPYCDKYDALLPKGLLAKQYASNMLGWS
jgi:ATP-dependent Lhr-like helicase